MIRKKDVKIELSIQFKIRWCILKFYPPTIEEGGIRDGERTGKEVNNEIL